MPAESLQVWQRRLLPHSDGGAYPSGGVADARHVAPGHVGGADGETDAVLAAHNSAHDTAKSAVVAGQTPRRKQRRSGILAPDGTTPLALLLFLAALAISSARLAPRDAVATPLAPGWSVADLAQAGPLRGIPRAGQVAAQAASTQLKIAGRGLKRATDAALKTPPWKLAEKAAGSATGVFKPKVEPKAEA